MRYLIIILFLIIANFIQSQNKKLYWFSISDSSKFPIIEQRDNYTILDFNDRELNNIFKKYNVISFKKSFPTSETPYLQTIFEMEIENYSLITELLTKGLNIFLNLEEVPEMKPLYIPNDLGLNGGELQEQEELNYIRAPEAWNISQGNSSIILGISESVNITHEELVGKSDILNGGSGSTYNGHGTSVSLFAAANTNNNVGISAIGFDSFIRSKSGGTNAVIELAQSGVKAINMSWGSCNLSENSINIIQMSMDEAYSNGAVLVAAAGNGAFSCSSLGAQGYHYPAANGNVIAVTVVGHLYDLNDPEPTHNNQKDRFEAVGNTYPTTTYNDSIDIAAPGRYVLSQDIGEITGVYSYDGGTSFAAPIVVGTIGLMLDVNYCLGQNEIESILKLTSRKIDQLSVNLSYQGQIGSGVLDAYEAVKMSKDMADAFGTVEVKDKILYRWFYKLETAPYEIKMTNNDVTGNARLKFKAKNNIEILSGDYYPDAGGYIDLSIDESLALNCLPPPISSFRSIKSSNDKDINSDIIFEVYPTLVNQDVTVLSKKTSLEKMSAIIVYNFFGLEVFKQDKITSNRISLNLEKLNEGIYILKVFDSKGQVLHTQKIVKK